MYKNLLFLVIIITFSYFIINHVSDMGVKEIKEKKEKVNNFSKPISTETRTVFREMYNEGESLLKKHKTDDSPVYESVTI